MSGKKLFLSLMGDFLTSSSHFLYRIILCALGFLFRVLLLLWSSGRKRPKDRLAELLVRFVVKIQSKLLSVCCWLFKRLRTFIMDIVY